MKIVINPLSANSQCASASDAEKHIVGILSALDYIEPALLSKRATLFFDPRMQERSLVRDEVLDETINKISGKKAADSRRKWYLYTKNRAKKIASQDLKVYLSSKGAQNAECIAGVVGDEVASEGVSFIGLGGCSILESRVLELKSTKLSCDFKSAFDKPSATALFPVYEPSPKHRKEPYFDRQRGENVAAMPLDKDDAQELILCAVTDGNDYWAYHEKQKKFFRFKLTNNNVYHGFQVEDIEVPPAVKNLLR